MPTVQSSKISVPENDGGATKVFEIDTLKELDATSIYQRNLELSKKDNATEEYKEVRITGF